MLEEEQLLLFDLINENYLEGFQVGMRWNNTYIPGGPFIYDDQSRERNKDWHRGFRAGFLKKHERQTAQEKTDSRGL